MILSMSSVSRAVLPDDVDVLKGMILEQAYLIEKLKGELHRHRRHRFGAMSEGLDQLELGIEELEIDLAKTGVPISDDVAEEKGRPKRKPLPNHLPRETIVHTPQETQCRCCGKPLRKMAEDVREVLDYVPGRFVVHRHVLEKFSCRDCGLILEGALPSLPIEKGAPGAGLLAHVLISKYADHLPLYRQSEIYAREDVDLSRSTLAGWVGKMAELLAPLAECIETHVLGGEILHTDDTPIPVLDPGRGKTRIGRLWTYVRDERPHRSNEAPAVFYKYSPDRKGERPREHLKDYKGYLHADGYSGYDRLYDKGMITEVACMAHIRRKFFDIHKATKSPIAEEALIRIAGLYAIEKQIRGSPPEQRRQLRQDKAKPLFEDLQTWLDKTLPTLTRTQRAGPSHALRHYADKAPGHLSRRWSPGIG